MNILNPDYAGFKLFSGLKKNQLITGLLLAFWLGVIVFAGNMLFKYETTAGEMIQAPALWPKESAISFSGKQPALLMFLHPKCPCSRASLIELQSLIRRVSGKIHVTVVFMDDRVFKGSDSDHDLESIASGIPGIRILKDSGGAEAKRFGARTSGQVVLYHESGKRIFWGGVTGARGHTGNNAGRKSIEDLILGKKNAAGMTPVFGCPLFNKEAHKGIA